MTEIRYLTSETPLSTKIFVDDRSCLIKQTEEEICEDTQSSLCLQPAHHSVSSTVSSKMHMLCVLLQIYTHLNNVFELLSKAVVESKQKVNIPKLNKEEPEEKEESEKPKKEERGTDLLSVCYNLTEAWWIFQQELKHFHSAFHPLGLSCLW